VSQAIPATAVVLAAGQGTRMVSDVPKVLHTICGRSLVGHVLAAVEQAGIARVIVVVGHGDEQVRSHLARCAAPADIVVQDVQLGTGHATRIALEAVPELTGTVLVVPGDAPGLRPETLAGLVAHRSRTGAGAVALTARLADPTGYGRVIRDGAGALERVVEERDATPAERALGEVATSVYAFDAAALRSALTRLSRDNAAGEEYLTDTLALLRSDGAAVQAVALADATEAAGVNDRVQLAAARRAMRDRLLAAWMRAGVSVIDPQTTWISVDVELEPDVTVHPNTQLHGKTRIARGAQVGPDVTLTDTTVGAGAVVIKATCEGAEIGPAAKVGPYTYLRAGTRLGAGAKAGGFVEMKAASLGAGSKVPHLSYVGDATIGERANIGAATVFVNYDGVDKHETVVGDDVRIGSDTMLVAPVRVGDGAYTAAGSVITEDVPAGALGIARARQRNVTGWVGRRRPGSRAARAGEVGDPHPDPQPVQQREGGR
jgi:bifunctional UDP-N-acetylglucosamine pyrophosphorylase/glucosamine-1-phosphate N-acetyltransferase